MFGSCFKPLSPMSNLNLNTMHQFETHISKKMFIYEDLSKNINSVIIYVFIRCNILFTSYADCLHKLGIKTLKYCRLEFEDILIFRIYYGLSDLQFDDYFFFSKRKYNTCSHEFVIQPKFYASCDQFRIENFFFNRIVKIWNNLPQDFKAFAKI